MPKYSRYTVLVDNLSSTTRTADLEYEFKVAGRIRDIIRDPKTRRHLAADADYAYRKLHGMTMQGRQIKVEWATRSDFKFFGWKWTEDTPSPPPKRGRSRSRSRSPSRSPSRSRSRSRSASRSHPGTPQGHPEHRGAVSDAPKERGDLGSESPHNN